MIIALVLLDDVGVDGPSHLEGAHRLSLASHDLGQGLVGDDDPAVVGILQLVLLDVVPDLLDDLASGSTRDPDDGLQVLIHLHRHLQMFSSGHFRQELMNSCLVS